MATLPTHVNMLESITLPAGQFHIGRGSPRTRRFSRLVWGELAVRLAVIPPELQPRMLFNELHSFPEAIVVGKLDPEPFPDNH